MDGDITEELAEHGPESVHVTDHFGRNMLHHAAIQGHNLVIKQLLEYGADPKAKDAFDKLPSVRC